MKLIDKVQKLTLIFQDQFMNNQLSWILSFHYDQNQMTFLIEIEAAISMISTHINNYSEPRDDITLKNMNGLGRFMLKICGLVKISELDVGRWRVGSPFLLDDATQLVPPQILLTRRAEMKTLKLSFRKRMSGYCTYYDYN